MKKGSASRDIGQNNLLDIPSTGWSALPFLVCSRTRFTASSLWRTITQIIQVNPPPHPSPPKKKEQNLNENRRHWTLGKVFLVSWMVSRYVFSSPDVWLNRVYPPATASKKIVDNEVITISFTPVGLSFRRICHRVLQPTAYLHWGTFWNRDKTISYFRSKTSLSLSFLLKWWLKFEREIKVNNETQSLHISRIFWKNPLS